MSVQRDANCKVERDSEASFGDGLRVEIRAIWDVEPQKEF